MVGTDMKMNDIKGMLPTISDCTSWITVVPPSIAVPLMAVLFFKIPSLTDRLIGRCSTRFSSAVALTASAADNIHQGCVRAANRARGLYRIDVGSSW